MGSDTLFLACHHLTSDIEKRLRSVYFGLGTYPDSPVVKNDIASGFGVAAFKIIKLKGVVPKEGWTLVLGTWYFATHFSNFGAVGYFYYCLIFSFLFIFGHAHVKYFTGFVYFLKLGGA